jgi:hypothetical protein
MRKPTAISFINVRLEGWGTAMQSNVLSETEFIMGSTVIINIWFSL